MKTTVVTTTIFVPKFLEGYAKSAKDHGEAVDFVVVGDVKSPIETAEFCRGIKNCLYMDLPFQENYLGRFPELDEHMPMNSISRRNIGHLYAYENGSDVLILLDDDNFAIDGVNHIGAHRVVGTRWCGPRVGSTTGWLNVCNALQEKHGVQFYPRGFPPAQRWKEGSYTGYSSEEPVGTVAVNGGLWINDPDIDAITRLERHLITTGLKYGETSFALEPGTWCPWNCQNTAISREALPSYFLSPYVGRHLDIWASYITSRVAEHMGQLVTFGEPLAYHERTPHNLYKDLAEEVPWIKETDHFVEVLRKFPVTGDSYREALLSIVVNLWTHWNPEIPEVKWKYLKGLMVWHDIFKGLGA